MMQSILVIDDNPELCVVVCKALETKGFRVTSAHNIVAGLELARASLPNLIICDVIMDKGDGYQLLTALGHDECTAAIPFIFMTGDPSRPGMQLGMQLGAQDYLAKPFKLQTLFDTVEATFRTKERIAQLSREGKCEQPAGIDRARRDI